jgi:hypothetical protein
MADSPEPREYERAPLYQRPLSGLVRIMERVFKLGMTQTDANKES